MASLLGKLLRHVGVVDKHEPPVAVDHQWHSPFVVSLLKPEAVVEPVVLGGPVDVNETLLKFGTEAALLDKVADPLAPLLELLLYGGTLKLALVMLLAD